MKPLLVLLLLIVTAPFARSEGHKARRDSLMHELRTTIERRDVYRQRKEDQLTELRRLLADARDDDSRFFSLGALLDEFRPYNTDSALAYCRRREELARRTGRRDLAINAALNTANVLGSMGLYIFAINLSTAFRADSIS